MTEMQHSIFTDPSHDPEAVELGEDFAAEAFMELAKSAAKRQAAGHRLSREEHKALREAAILERVDTHWPDRAACAKALGVTPKIIEGYAAEKAPIPPHSPIAKEPVYLWVLELLRQKGGKPANDSDLRRQRDQEDIRFRRLKNDRLENTMTAEADAAAMEGLAKVVKACKNELIWTAPDAIWKTCKRKKVTKANGIKAVRKIITDALTKMAIADGAIEDLKEKP